jgi:hypothetical protein
MVGGMDYFTILDDLVSKYISLKDDDLCLCNSGKLFKDCHKLPGDQKPLDFNKIQKNVLKIFAKKTCYFCDHNCSKTKAASHSIPRKSLKTIHKDNHILRFVSPGIPELSKVVNFNQLVPKEIGINEAGSFYGFCSHHDNQLFSPIEKEPIEPTNQQNCLFLFRALCKELYTSKESLRMKPIYSQLIESKDDINYQHLLNIENILLLLCQHKSISEMISDYNRLVSDLRNKSFSEYSSITIVTEPPPINCCSYVNPAFFLDGSIYQDFNDLSLDLESFSFTVFTSEDKGFFHFCWSNKTNFSKFFDQLLNIEKEKLVDFLIQMIFAYSENHAFNKEWWEGLHPQKRDHLKTIFMSHGMGQRLCYNPAYDFYDMGFSDLTVVDIKKYP